MNGKEFTFTESLKVGSILQSAQETINSEARESAASMASGSISSHNIEYMAREINLILLKITYFTQNPKAIKGLKRVLVSVLLAILIGFLLLWGTVFYAVNKEDEVAIRFPGGRMVLTPAKEVRP